nr:hypothetical protein [Kutzneria buriramensis]WKX07380.1 hypothetical protein Q4V64_07730 [Kutzneria buriramensis]
MSTSSGSASLPGPDSFGCPSLASFSVQSTRDGRDLAGTSRTRPPVQYAKTCPSSTSTTASGPFSKRGSVPPAGVLAGAAFRTPGRRDVDALLAVRAGRGAACSAAAGTGAVWVFSCSVMAAASGAGPVGRVRSSGAGWPVNVVGTEARAAGAG